MEKGLKREVIEENSSRFASSVSWLFALLVLTNGLLNIYRGNDPALGVAFMVLSLVYLPPLSRTAKRYLGFGIPLAVKLLLAILLVWIGLAVGAIPEGFYPELTE